MSRFESGEESVLQFALSGTDNFRGEGSQMFVRFTQDRGVHFNIGVGGQGVGNVRKIAIAVVMMLLLQGAAYAEPKTGPATVQTDAERKHDAEIDKAYRDAVKRSDIGLRPAKTDPWGTVRPASGDTTKH